MKHDLIAFLRHQDSINVPSGLTICTSGDFAAVVTTASSKERYGIWEKKHRLKSAPRHQRWLEEIMEFGPVIPVVAGEKIEKRQVAGLISANQDILSNLVKRLTNKLQFQVTISWTEDQVLERFRDMPDIAPLFASKSISSKNLKKSIERLKAHLRAEFLDILSSACEDISELPTQGDILANFVFLVPDNQVRSIDDALEAIDAIWTEGFAIKQIGPSPATSFASLTISKFSQHDLTRAHCHLGLSPNQDRGLIRPARKNALQNRPSEAAQIRRSARLLEAANAVGVNCKDILLMDTWSENKSSQVFAKG